MSTLCKIAGIEGLYRLVGESFLNNYYVISSPGTCRLMASPEVVGFDAYTAMVPATETALKYLSAQEPDVFRKVNILTILRGGLNYPVEECCHNCGVTVSDINFMSCERVIRDGVITGLDVKYEKIHTEPLATVMIGDIIASGETLQWCLNHYFETFLKAGVSVRKVIFCTVGGTRAIKLMEKFTEKYRAVWPGFEGFDCIFYEGIFSVYEDHGTTGVNTPCIDFGWKDGFVSPEFREYVMDYAYAPALLEKCIIYDGGARRYNIGDHAAEVREYWQSLLEAASKSDFAAFVEEKIGYPAGTSYEDWLAVLHYAPETSLKGLYDKERCYTASLLQQTLAEICRARLAQLDKDFNIYTL